MVSPGSVLGPKHTVLDPNKAHCDSLLSQVYNSGNTVIWIFECDLFLLFLL